LDAGQVIAIGTDGIWEARNADGRMFGKQALQAMLREHRDRPAVEILSVILDALRRFVFPLEIQDDATLVIVKMEG
jgi:sigma-B regulation protein RsbU (phosphoserine phosphatase)